MMIIIELPRTDGKIGYRGKVDMYKEWLEENNISYVFQYNRQGINDSIQIDESDAIMFRLRFGT